MSEVKSAKARLRSFFKGRGNNITANQAAERFGVTVGSVRRIVGELRNEEDLNITLKHRYTTNGYLISTYQKAPRRQSASF